MATVKYSGPIASFRCPTNADIRSLKVHFSPKQEGTGDPSPDNIRPIVGWDGVEVSQSQNNLFNENSITYSRWTDGAGNVIANARYGCISEKIRSNSTSFTLIAMSDRPNSMSIIEYDANGNFLRRTHGNQVKYVKVNATWSSTSYIAVQISDSNGGTTITPEYVSQRKMMLIEGTDNPVAYEPYHGEAHKIEFPGVRKNLLDINKLFSEGTTNSTVEGITRIQIPVSNGTYTISTNVIDNDSTNIASVFAWVNGLTPETVPNSSGSGVFKDAPRTLNVTNGIISIGIRTRSSSYLAWTAETFSPYYIQLESGDTATAYEPYTNTVYGGWVDLISGEVSEEDVLFVIDEDTPIRFFGSSHGTYKVSYDLPNTGANANAICCNYFGLRARSTASSNYPLKNKMCCLPYNTETIVAEFGMPDEITTQQDWIDWLTENGVIDVIYPIATPSTYHLAPTQLQTFLGQNNVWSNADYVEVEYDLHETQDILARKQFIIASQPHIVKPAAAPLQNFVTDMAAPLKECKVYFSPVQEGEGDPSPENIRAITGWTGVKLFRAGKNLMSDNHALVGAQFKDVDGNYEIGTANVFKMLSIDVPKNTALHIHKEVASGSELGLGNEIAYYGAPVNRIGSMTNYNNRNFNTGDYPYVYLMMGKNLAIDDSVTQWQIEIGNAATAYEVPKGTTETAADWSDTTGIIYGGYVDLVTGEIWQTHKKKQIVKNENDTSWNSWGTKLMYNTGILGTNNEKRKAGTIVLSDTLIPIGGTVNPQQVTSLDEIRYYGVDARYSQYFFMANPNELSNTEWRNWLYSTYQNAYVCYELETPILLATLTPAQLKSLRGMNNIWSNSNGPIELSYWKH